MGWAYAVGMNKNMKGKQVKQKVASIGDKTGSDNLFDGKKESGKGMAVKKTRRMSRRPSN